VGSLIRITPPAVTTAMLQRFDADILTAALHKLDIADHELDEQQRITFTLPYRAGGIALRKHSSIAHIAFFSCAAQSLPFINTIITPLINRANATASTKWFRRQLLSQQSMQPL
jgi:hypothetical protein